MSCRFGPRAPRLAAQHRQVPERDPNVELLGRLGGEDLDLPAEHRDLLAERGKAVERPFQLGKEQVGLIHGEELPNSLHHGLK